MPLSTSIYVKCRYDAQTHRITDTGFIQAKWQARDWKPLIAFMHMMYTCKHKCHYTQNRRYTTSPGSSSRAKFILCFYSILNPCKVHMQGKHKEHHAADTESVRDKRPGQATGDSAHMSRLFSIFVEIAGTCKCRATTKWITGHDPSRRVERAQMIESSAWITNLNELSENRMVSQANQMQIHTELQTEAPLGHSDSG